MIYGNNDYVDRWCIRDHVYNSWGEVMAKIDSDELIKRIEKLDPWYHETVQMKLAIIKIIKKMVEEQTDGDNS